MIDVFYLSDPVKDDLERLKIAYETCYQRDFTYNDMVLSLISCVEDGDPSVWAEFCRLNEEK